MYVPMYHLIASIIRAVSDAASSPRPRPRLPSAALAHDTHDRILQCVALLEVLVLEALYCMNSGGPSQRLASHWLTVASIRRLHAFIVPTKEIFQVLSYQSDQIKRLEIIIINNSS